MKNIPASHKPNHKFMKKTILFILLPLFFFAFQFSHKNSSLGKKCPFSEFFWSTFSRIRTEYADLQSKSPYSVRMWENLTRKL